MPKVALHVVTWNGKRYLPDFFASLDAQTRAPDVVRVIDNASSDGTFELLRDRLNLTAVRNVRNSGFAAGHNQALRLAFTKWEGEDLSHCYVLVVNQDLVFDPKAIEELVLAMERRLDVGSAQGKILRAYVEHPGDDVFAETVCVDVTDSTGIVATRGRRFADRGSGMMDNGQYDAEGEVFGVTGACAIYRASALAAVRFEDEVFDGAFFMYGEDADLAWRLQWAGWKSLYVPSARVYHHRSLAGSERPGWWERMKNRRAKPRYLAMCSTRNRIFTVWKNESIINGFLAAPWVAMADLRQLIYSLLFEPWVLVGCVKGLAQLPRLWQKRRVIMRSRKVSSRDIRKWFR